MFRFDVRVWFAGMRSMRREKAFANYELHTTKHANDAITPNETTLTIQTKPFLVKFRMNTQNCQLNFQ